MSDRVVIHHDSNSITIHVGTAKLEDMNSTEVTAWLEKFVSDLVHTNFQVLTMHE